MPSVAPKNCSSFSVRRTKRSAAKTKRVVFLFRGILGRASGVTRISDLLRLVLGEEMHGRLPRVHRCDERTNSQTKCRFQSVQVQTHRQFESERREISNRSTSIFPFVELDDRRFRRYRPVRDFSQSGHVAERFEPRTVRMLVYGQTERSDHRWLFGRRNVGEGKASARNASIKPMRSSFR